MKWRLEELVARANIALARGDSDGESRRVQWLPATRTARFYTTLGLLDRPLEMQGRTAFYGPRHLAQLVCIKRLQARGLSLQQVQENLAGAGESDLQRLADLPDEALSASVADERAPQAGQTRAPGSFWSSPPQEATPTKIPRSPEMAICEMHTVIRLAPGATLHLEVPVAALGPEELQSLGRAARELVRRLRELSLIPEPPENIAGSVEDKAPQAGRKESSR